MSKQAAGLKGVLARVYRLTFGPKTGRYNPEYYRNLALALRGIPPEDTRQRRHWEWEAMDALENAADILEAVGEGNSEDMPLYRRIAEQRRELRMIHKYTAMHEYHAAQLQAQIDEMKNAKQA